MATPTPGLSYAQALQAPAPVEMTSDLEDNQPECSIIEYDNEKNIHKVAGMDGVYSSVQFTLQPASQVIHLDWDRHALQPYAKYTELYGERKFTKGPEKPCTINFLTHFPAELRNQIYREILHFPYLELAVGSTISSNGLARKPHMRCYKYHVKPELGLLRTCKQTNNEASSIFYSENEFQIAAMYGSEILRSFCHTIGRANTACLRKLAVQVPLVDEDQKVRNNGGAHHTKKSFYRFNEPLSKLGLDFDDPKLNISRPLSRTTANGGLGPQKLDLVLPHSYQLIDPFDENVGNDGIRFELHDSFSEKRKNELKIRFVVLEDSPSNTYAVRND